MSQMKANKTYMLQKNIYIKKTEGSMTEYEIWEGFIK